jgi:putative spermidine/putrescine transport system permease protein
MNKHPLLRLHSILVYAFIASPLLVVFIVSFNADAVVTFPPSGWSVQWYKTALLNRDFLTSLVYSTQVALLTTTISLAVGIPASFTIVRRRSRVSEIARTLATAPLTFPQVILGLALLQFFGTTLRVEISMWTLVVGHVVITTPYVVQSISSALYGFNRSLEEAAHTLGASPIQTLLKVTLPAIRPAMLTAGLFSFILSFDNAGISLFLSTPGKVPIPIRMFQYVDTQYDPTIAVISSALMLYSFAMLGILQRLGMLGQVFGGRDRA